MIAGGIYIGIAAAIFAITFVLFLDDKRSRR